MLFVTNRVLNEGPTPVNPDGSYSFPRSVSFKLNNNQAEQSVYFCRRESANRYIEIGSQAFFDTLRAANAQQILLYLHGYASLPEPAIFPKAEELQRLFNQKLDQSIMVIPLIWPCDNDFGVVKDYFDDQIAADASAFAFMRLLEKFLSWRDENSTLENPCTKWINVLAHSMGNRVLRGALNLAVQYYQQGGIPLIFRNSFLVAADIDNHSLEPGQPAELIPQTSRNVVVYFAADDLAMRASKVANVRDTSRRLGQTGPARMDRVDRNVYAFDCGDFNNLYDSPAGHGYFTRDNQGNAGLLFDHLWACILTGRVPIEPPTTRLQILRNRFWLPEA